MPAQPGSLPPPTPDRLWAFRLCHVNSRVWCEAESQESGATEILPGLSKGGKEYFIGRDFCDGGGSTVMGREHCDGGGSIAIERMLWSQRLQAGQYSGSGFNPLVKAHVHVYACTCAVTCVGTNLVACMCEHVHTSVCVSHSHCLPSTALCPLVCS